MFVCVYKKYCSTLKRNTLKCNNVSESQELYVDTNKVYNSLYEILGHTKLINVVRNKTAVVSAFGGDWLAHNN